MQYEYNPDLSFAANKRLAIAAHEAEGEMVPVVEGGDGDQYVSQYLFPTGATLDRSPGAMPREAYDRRRCLNDLDHAEGKRERLRNIRKYWEIRVKSAEEAFRIAKEDARRRPTDAALDRLVSLVEEVKRLRERLAAAERELNPPPPPLPPMTEERKQEVARAAAERYRLEGALAAIDIGPSPAERK
jgi:hypothetical protein